MQFIVQKPKTMFKVKSKKKGNRIYTQKYFEVLKESQSDNEARRKHESLNNKL